MHLRSLLYPEFHQLSLQEQTDIWAGLSSKEQAAISPTAAAEKAKLLALPKTLRAGPEASADKLKRIRERTCYSVLRSWLKCIFISVIFVFVFVGYRAVFAAPTESLVILSCAGLFLAVVATIALYQSSLLLVDIADAAIQGRE